MLALVFLSVLLFAWSEGQIWREENGLIMQRARDCFAREYGSVIEHIFSATRTEKLRLESEGAFLDRMRTEMGHGTLFCDAMHDALSIVYNSLAFGLARKSQQEKHHHTQYKARQSNARYDQDDLRGATQHMSNLLRDSEVKDRCSAVQRSLRRSVGGRADVDLDSKAVISCMKNHSRMALMGFIGARYIDFKKTNK